MKLILAWLLRTAVRERLEGEIKNSWAVACRYDKLPIISDHDIVWFVNLAPFQSIF